MNHAQIFKRIASAALAFSALFSGTFAVAQTQQQMLDTIVAVVDDDVVLRSELNARMQSIMQRIAASGNEAPPVEALLPQVLDRLISERLQLSMGARMGVNIPDDELRQAVARLAASEGLTIEQFRDKTLQQGGSFQDFLEELRNDMVMQQVQQARVLRRINISPAEVDNFLNSEEGLLLTSPDKLLGHILLSVPSTADKAEEDAIQAKASDLVTRIRAGEDFRQLAILNSSGENALNGGDWGWRKAVQLPSLFVEPVNALDVGGVTDPIRSGAGFHILKVYDQRGGGEQFIEQHFVRHILIKPNQIRSDDKTRDLLLSIRKRIDNGEDFATLAKEYSEDPGSALKGGELGWSVPGMFVPQFEQAMTDIPLNQVSEPFRSQFGWHILQVTERRNEDFSDTIKRRQVENLLRSRKFEEELQVWLQEIRDEAFVEVKVGTQASS